MGRTVQRECGKSGTQMSERVYVGEGIECSECKTGKLHEIRREYAGKPNVLHYQCDHCKVVFGPFPEWEKYLEQVEASP